MAKSENASLRRWHLKPDLWMCRTRERVFQVEATVCANFLRSEHDWFITEQVGSSWGRKAGEEGLGDKAGDGAVTQPHYFVMYLKSI